LSEPRSSETDADRDEPVDRMRAELYRRLMEAQEQIAHVLYRRGVSQDDVLAALDAVDEEISSDQRREDLYLSGLEHYVAALGGRIEVRAVFGKDEILVHRVPQEGSGVPAPENE
jgi:pyruvate/2-oxoglutarate dehydrogenase complex dihydrolipoamide acyltransferase (E2) component